MIAAESPDSTIRVDFDRGPNNHLFIGEIGGGQVREYDISGTTPALAGLRIIGSKQNSGPVTDSQFNFWFTTNQPMASASVAVDKDGILNVRIVDASSDFIPSPQTATPLEISINPGLGNTRVIPPTRMAMPATGLFICSITSSSIRLIQTGWAAPGQVGWGMAPGGLTGRYMYPSDGSTVRRTLMDGTTPRDFLFSLGGAIQTDDDHLPLTVTAYALETTGMRSSAIVGTNWRGVMVWGLCRAENTLGKTRMVMDKSIGIVLVLAVTARLPGNQASIGHIFRQVWLSFGRR